MEAGVQPLKLAQKCLCGLVGKCSWSAERLSVPTPPRHLPTPEPGFSNTVKGVMRGTAKGCELVTAKSLPFSCWPKRKKSNHVHEDSMDHSLVVAKGLAKINETMSHALQGHPRQTGQSEEFWQNMAHWRRKWQPTPVFLPQEPHEQYEKAKRHDTERQSPQVGRCPIYYWGRAESNYK